MRALTRLLATCLYCLLLAACGGGGGDGGGGAPATSISSNTSTLSFTAHPSSGPLTQDATLTFTGDGVIVGFAPGVSVPSWLQIIDNGLVAANQASFSLSVDAGGLAEGTYQTSVRFLTGKIPPGGALEDATGISYVDIPVKLKVVKLGISSGINTTSIRGSGNLTGALGITASSGWTATADQPWLLLASNSGSGNTNLAYTAETASLGTGSHTATVTLTHTASGLFVTTSVTVTMVSPQLTVSPTSLSFTVDASTTAGQITTTFAISDQLGGTNADLAASWSVSAISVPWLDVTPPSGSTSPTQQITVSLLPDQLATLANGTFTGEITLAYTAEDGTGLTRKVPVTLNFSLPRVTLVAPHVVSAQSQYRVILRGNGFSGLGTNPVMFGSTAASNPTIVSDTELRVTYPALSAGTVNVSIPNALGITHNATLVVQDDAALPGGTFASSGSINRLFFDNERKVLYGVNSTSELLHRYAMQDNTWVALPSLYVGTLHDAALSPDGRTVVMVTADKRIFELDLTTVDATPQLAAQVPLNASSYASIYLRRIAFANDGKAVITTGYYGSGHTQTFSYDPVSNVLTGIPGLYSVYGAQPNVSGDGSVMLVPQCCLSPAPQMMGYNPTTGQSYSTSVFTASTTSISLNRDGSRMMFNDGKIYNSSFIAQGNLGWHSNFVVSPDGTRAYCYVIDSAGAKQIDVYDITTPVAGAYAKVATYPLSNTIKGTGSANIALGISGDGKSLFVWAFAALVVIPL